MASPRSLRALLGEAAVLDGRIQFYDVWPAVRKWGAKVFDPDELLLMYAASRPAGMEGSFAGTPPEELDGRDLWSVQWSRGLYAPGNAEARSTGHRELPAQAGGRLTLWFADFSEWSSFQATDDFIDMGPSTPHLDWPLAPIERMAGLDEWAAHPLLAMAARTPAVGLSVVDEQGLDELALRGDGTLAYAAESFRPLRPRRD